MNDSLCSCCQDIFDHGAFDLPVDRSDWNEDSRADAYKLKVNVPHHASIEELRECAETECRLCKAIWLLFLPVWPEPWLAEHTELKDQSDQFFIDGKSYRNTQLFYSVILRCWRSTSIKVVVFNHVVEQGEHPISADALIVDLDLCGTRIRLF